MKILEGNKAFYFLSGILLGKGEVTVLLASVLLSSS